MKKRLMMAAAIASLALAGCGTLQNFFDGGNGASMLVVQYATMKYVEAAGKDDAAKLERAVRVRSVAEEVQEAAKGDSVTLAALEAYVNDKLPPDLSPADQLLARALVRAVAQEVAGRVGEGILDPEQLLAVNTILDWVVEATVLVEESLAPA